MKSPLAALVLLLLPSALHAQEGAALARLLRAAARAAEEDGAHLAGREVAEGLGHAAPKAVRAVEALDGPGLRFAEAAGEDAAEIYARAGAAGVYRAARHPEFVEAAREARRLGRLDEFLAGVRTHGDAFVVWVGRRWKQVGLLTAMATFVAVAPTAVEEAGRTARAGVGEMGGLGVFGCVCAALAAAFAWSLLRPRARRV